MKLEHIPVLVPFSSVLQLVQIVLSLQAQLHSGIVIFFSSCTDWLYHELYLHVISISCIIAQFIVGSLDTKGGSFFL